jgi:nitrogen fixation protein FixH
MSFHMSQAQPPRPITGRKVLFMMVAFFGVVIGVNLVMMRLAIQTLPGTEVDSAYSASLAYEKEIATARAQSARNWKVDAHVERSGQGGATLRVEARDNLGRPMSGLTFQGRFERPTDRRADLPVALAEVGSAFIAERGTTRRANGIWCSKASRRDNGCFSPRTACC